MCAATRNGGAAVVVMSRATAEQLGVSVLLMGVYVIDYTVKGRGSLDRPHRGRPAGGELTVQGEAWAAVAAGSAPQACAAAAARANRTAVLSHSMRAELGALLRSSEEDHP